MLITVAILTVSLFAWVLRTWNQLRLSRNQLHQQEQEIDSYLQQKHHLEKRLRETETKKLQEDLMALNNKIASAKHAYTDLAELHTLSQQQLLARLFGFVD